MKKVIAYLKPYKKQLIFMFIIHALSTFLSLLMPYLMSAIVSEGIAKQESGTIVRLCLLMLGVGAVSFLFSLLTVRMNAKVSSSFGKSLSRAVFSKINSLSFEEYSRVGTSGLLTRSTDDIFSVEDAAGGLVATVATVPVLLVGGVILSFSADAVLALIFLAAIPLVLLLARFVTRPLGDMWDKSDRYIDVQNRIVRERLSGLRVIRAFGKEDAEHARAKDATENMTRYIIRANVRGGYLDDAVALILNLATVLILVVGARRMETSSVLRAGDVIAVIQYVALIMNAVLMLSWTIAWLPHLRVSVRRIGEVLELPSEESAASEHATLSGDLVLSDVTFSYPGAEAPVLAGISFTIRGGETIALIGGTGSGKSTLIKLLLDFYTPEAGSISFGGTDYTALPRAAVRDNFSVALQKSMIFEGSVRDNVRMGNEAAEDAALLDALDIAEMSSFLAQHEEGLDYRLAGAGANISGGQKQRINIARALIRPAKVYIFDDSFSALDYLTESRLRKKLNRALAGKTQIVVTQRAATAMRCDRIVVLDGGRTVGIGKHEDLLSSCPVYREIYDSQLGAKDAARGGDAE